MAMVILEDQMPMHREILMIDKLIIIGAYALPAIILLLICFYITRK